MSRPHYLSTATSCQPTFGSNGRLGNLGKGRPYWPLLFAGLCLMTTGCGGGPTHREQASVVTGSDIWTPHPDPTKEVVKAEPKKAAEPVSVPPQDQGLPPGAAGGGGNSLGIAVQGGQMNVQTPVSDLPLYPPAAN